MSTDDPTTPPRRTEAPLHTRELLFRTIVRIRRDLAQVERLTEIVGIHQPTPAKVTRAIEVLQDWSAGMVRTGRSGPGRHRPKP